MINQIIFLPINSGPIAPEDEKVVLGIFILLNIIWFISLVIQLISYIRCKIKGDYYSGLDNAFAFMINTLMSFTWIAIILVFLGTLISHYL